MSSKSGQGLNLIDGLLTNEDQKILISYETFGFHILAKMVNVENVQKKVIKCTFFITVIH